MPIALVYKFSYGIDLSISSFKLVEENGKWPYYPPEVSSSSL
jgi:hypothetical protein